ncbi:MAG: DUF4965 domain-containing protein [Armatimonadetes bacterium]|nr:DUF4965 domain-containing protein [Armatimonadota bacterium]
MRKVTMSTVPRLHGRYPLEHLLYETVISKLGARINITPQPSREQALLGVLGTFYDVPVSLTLAVRFGGRVYALPLSSSFRASGHTRFSQAFTDVRQEIGMTFIAYHCDSLELPFTCVFSIAAPFYPGDVKLSTAPFFYISVELNPKRKMEAAGSMLLALDNPFTTDAGMTGIKSESRLYDSNGMIGFTFEDMGIDGDRIAVATDPSATTYRVGDYERLLYKEFEDTGRLPNEINRRPAHAHGSGLAWEFSLSEKPVRKTFVLAGWHSCGALRIEDEQRKFLYTEHFDGLDDVLRFAARNVVEIESKLEVFEDTLAKSSLSDSVKKLTAFAFQSYIANTWWVGGDPDWFTVWEGSCRFHSTVDLAFHSELLTLVLWPDLLRKQLEEWSFYPIGDYMSHDVGDERYIFGQSYTADMPAEEAANYIFLLHAYWRRTGDGGFVKSKRDLVTTLLGYLRETDIDGDGIPDDSLSVRNTVDDGTDLIHSAPGQTYLAGKALGAFISGMDFAELFEDEHMSSVCYERVRTLCSTLAEKLWLGDHFAISLGPNDPGESGYSIYAAQGLLYPFISGCDLGEAPLDLFARDIMSHIARLMGPFGCPHTSADFNVWISQNIWRDLVGTYLGVGGLIENAERYWRFEHTRNVWDTGAYTDVYRYGRHGTDLERYPRGTDSFGYLLAQAGISFDAVRKTLRLAPQADSVTVPIIVLADWDRMVVPWLAFERCEAGYNIHLSSLDAFRSLEEITVHIGDFGGRALAVVASDGSRAEVKLCDTCFTGIAGVRFETGRRQDHIILRPAEIATKEIRIEIYREGCC